MWLFRNNVDIEKKPGIAKAMSVSNLPFIPVCPVVVKSASLLTFDK